MIQANTWYRLAAGLVQRHEKLDFDQDINGAHCEHRYGKIPARKLLLNKMSQFILLRPNSVQRKRKSSFNMRNNLVEAINFFSPYSIQIAFN